MLSWKVLMQQQRLVFHSEEFPEWMLFAYLHIYFKIFQLPVHFSIDFFLVLALILMVLLGFFLKYGLLLCVEKKRHLELYSKLLNSELLLFYLICHPILQSLLNLVLSSFSQFFEFQLLQSKILNRKTVKMSKKAFQQLNIIPYSISVISNNPDVSSASFTAIFDQKKTKDELAQYKIKVKKPYEFSAKSSNSLAQANKNNPDKYTENEYSLSDEEQREPKIEAEQIPLRQGITGYEICKTSFSQEEIIQAFKVIDINKDSVITEEDIVFFLEYIKQPYTKQQVRQMIQMVSSDKKKVTFQDFKKISKGSIIPFADIKIPDQHTKSKKLIFENIKNSPSLYQQNPSILISASKNDIISTKKFEESKKLSKNTQFESIKLIDEQEELAYLVQKIQLLSEQDFQFRKDQFNSIEIVNVTEIIKNYNQIFRSSLNSRQHKFISSKQIAKLLEISDKESKLLYGDKKNILAKTVVLQAIAFSPINKIKKLQLGMIVMLKKKKINLSELYFLFQILKGKDESGSVKKKLLTVFKSKNISKQQEIDKFYALELINNYSFNFDF